jgi:single-stranded DNA-specific DHH superfamily exonuclease
MISKEQIEEIRAYLEKAENPLFIFDDDPDGLSSFLLLWKLVRKGHWFPFTHNLRNAHQLLGAVEVLQPDLIVLLDMPVVDQEFVDLVTVPILHIDHHPPITLKGSHYHYYNPRVTDDNDSRPTTYWAYQVSQSNLWIGMVGMISDWFVPEYTADFSKNYPDLIDEEPKSQGYAYFETELGRLAKIFSFCLKGKKEESTKCIKALMMIENPYEILRQETPSGRLIYKYTEKFNKKYEIMKMDAIEMLSAEKIFLYAYPYVADSFSSLLSTELVYRFPEKIVIVARMKDMDTIMSIRSRCIIIEPLLQKALEGLEGFGGGHDLACGCKIANEDFNTFLERFKVLIDEAEASLKN